MAHGYHNLKHWDQWLSQHFLGAFILQSERESISKLIENEKGKHALLIGVPQQADLLKTCTNAYQSLLTPLTPTSVSVNTIESDFHSLPIMTGSIDLLILPHVLEFVENPRELINEACRVIKPEGLMIVCGFNPYNLFGIKQKMPKNDDRFGHFLYANTIKSWLTLADFALEKQRYIIHQPLISNQKFFKYFDFMNWIGSHLWLPFGAVYVLIARAKVLPLTPIRLKWKQQLSGINMSTTISGHIARLTK